MTGYVVVLHLRVLHSKQGDANTRSRYVAGRACLVVGEDLVVLHGEVADVSGGRPARSGVQGHHTDAVTPDLVACAVWNELSRKKIPNPLWSVELSRTTLLALGESPM